MATIVTLGQASTGIAAFLERAPYIPGKTMAQLGLDAFNSMNASSTQVQDVVTEMGRQADQWGGVFQLPRWPNPVTPIPVLIQAPTSGLNLSGIAMAQALAAAYGPLAVLAMTVPHLGPDIPHIAGRGILTAVRANDTAIIQRMTAPVMAFLAEAARQFGTPIPQLATPSTTGRDCCSSCKRGAPCEESCPEHHHAIT